MEGSVYECRHTKGSVGHGFSVQLEKFKSNSSMSKWSGLFFFFLFPCKTDTQVVSFKDGMDAYMVGRSLKIILHLGCSVIEHIYRVLN